MFKQVMLFFINEEQTIDRQTNHFNKKLIYPHQTRFIILLFCINLYLFSCFFFIPALFSLFDTCLGFIQTKCVED